MMDWKIASAVAMVVFGTFCGRASAGLKDAYADDFRIGVALQGLVEKAYSPAELTLIKNNFNAVTPENCMKAGLVHPQEKEWHFEEPDTLVDFAQKNHMDVFGHTLVWHQQCPAWFFKEGDKDAPRDVVLARLKEHIFTLMGRYKGKIRSWDVVNEAIATTKDDYLRDTPWLKAIGPDYIEQAFQFAHQADPGAELQYNDYSIEAPEKLAKVLRLLKDLKSKGIVVTSVGIQGHWQLDHVPFDDIEAAIDALSQAGVKVAITELDLDVMFRNPQGPDASEKAAIATGLKEQKPESAELAQRQAEQYTRLFEIFKKHRQQIERVTFWGVDDAHTWLNTWPMNRYDHPMLWDRDALPKPAYEAVMKAAK